MRFRDNSIKGRGFYLSAAAVIRSDSQRTAPGFRGAGDSQRDPEQRRQSAEREGKKGLDGIREDPAHGRMIFPSESGINRDDHQGHEQKHGKHEKE